MASEMIKINYSLWQEFSPRPRCLHLLLHSNPACQVFSLKRPSLLYVLFCRTAPGSQGGCLMLLGKAGGPSLPLQHQVL